MEQMTIGQLAAKSGIRPSALRFYEQVGVLPEAARVNGRRRYPPDAVELVRVARFAQSVGFSLAEIRHLFSRDSAGARLQTRWRPLALAKLRELDAVIKRARQMKSAISYGLECGCIRIEDCLPRPKRKSHARR